MFLDTDYIKVPCQCGTVLPAYPRRLLVNRHHGVTPLIPIMSVA
jgi:hypothetical protein